MVSDEPANKMVDDSMVICYRCDWLPFQPHKFMQGIPNYGLSRKHLKILKYCGSMWYNHVAILLGDQRSVTIPKGSPRQEELVKRCDAFKAKQEEMFLGETFGGSSDQRHPQVSSLL